MTKDPSKITVTSAPGDGYEMTLTITGIVDQDVDVFVRELLTLAAQAALPALGDGFDEAVMDVLEPKFRDREMRRSAPSEFDLGFEAGKKAERDESAAKATPETPAEGLTLAGLQAVPVGHKVIDRQGDAWKRQDGGRWLCTSTWDADDADSVTLSSRDLHRHWSPLRREGHPFAAGVDTSSEF